MDHNNLDENEKKQIIRELGEKLRDIREAHGLSIAMIADITKIQKRYLIAIEEGELSKLPKGPYMRGFIRQYCEFLSARDLWNSYAALTPPQMAQSVQQTGDTEQDYIAPPKVFKTSAQWWIYLVVIISLAAAGWITWNYRGEITGISTSPINGGTAVASQDRQTSAAVPSVDTAVSGNDAVSVDLNWMDGRSASPAASTTTPSMGQTAIPPATPVVISSADQPVTPSVDQAATPAATPPVEPGTTTPPVATATAVAVPTAKNTLHIRAIANVWLSVSSGGQSLYSGTLRSGESKSFTIANKAVRVRYGNPAGAVVSWNGATANPLQSSSSPVSRTYHPGGAITER